MSAADHAALMDKVYRRQRYIYDLTRKYYLFGRDRLIRDLRLKPGARVIEIGCGTSRNLVKIGQAYPDARLFGLDASQEMLISSHASVARAGMADRVKLVQAYAEDLSPSLFGESDPFDAAVFSYSLSMIPDWKKALHAAQGALAPGGTVHVVDFGDLKGLGPVAEHVLRAWLSLFHVAPREELLRTIEAGDGHKHWGALTLLPARYAFVWTARREAAFWSGAFL
ncbi:MAG: class I SAM-dependent methyltransferase [Rhizomicrobium sp.]